MSRRWRLAGSPGQARIVDAAPCPAPSPASDDLAVIEVEAVSLGPLPWARDAACPGLAVVGQVVEAGPGGRHVDGRRVLVGTHHPCGECDVCRRGGAAVCPQRRALGVDQGGLAERVVVPARWLVALDGELAVPGAAAAVVLGHDAALAYALYARAGVGPREPTVVVGDDATARLLVDVLAAKSAPPGRHHRRRGAGRSRRGPRRRRPGAGAGRVAADAARRAAGGARPRRATGAPVRDQRRRGGARAARSRWPVRARP
ncbi:MAG: alcohol dehydrogenase catalytic domain-containing protein [Kofleriaceae bacterium]|nr:alcohol dehydrogenase catalytic domain-containing protein [Kofleriaceae bacterium]